MTVTSLLALDFSAFGPVEWSIVGALALIVIIAFIAGCKKGFSNMSLRPISWAAACTAFVLLDLNLHQVGVDMFQSMGMDATMASLFSGTMWAIAAVVARGIVFGIIAGLIACSKSKKLKKAAKADYREKYTGEAVLPNENKAYKTTAINGKIKPGPLNRLFGGLFMIVNVAVVVAIIASIVFTVLYLTPLKEAMAIVYARDGEFYPIWNFVNTNLLDFFMIAFFCTLVVKGFKDGILNGIRLVICPILKLAVIIFAFYLPFAPFAQEGQALGFLKVGAVNLANLIPLTETIGIDVMVVVMQVAFGIVLAIVGSLLVKLIAWLLGKILNVVDKVSVLWFLDGILGAIVYAVIALALIFVIVLILYSIEYLGGFKTSMVFTDASVLMNNFYNMFNVTVSTSLEGVWAFFA